MWTAPENKAQQMTMRRLILQQYQKKIPSKRYLKMLLLAWKLKFLLNPWTIGAGGKRIKCRTRSTSR
eukprot:5027089-Amphidinium_carterae.3